MKPVPFIICVLVMALLAVSAAAADPDMTINGEPTTLGVPPGPVSATTAGLVTAVSADPVLAAIPDRPLTAPTINIVTTVETLPPTTVQVLTTTTWRPLTEPAGPQVGWLTVLSTPSGAEVSIDGTAAGVTPVSGRELGAGTHTVRITMAGYEPFQTQKTIGAGEQASVDADLKAVPVTMVPTTGMTRPLTALPTVSPCVGCDKGWIRVNANVDGATVSFDDLTPGCTIAAGSCDTEVGTTNTPFRTFTVRKPGYQVFTGPVTAWSSKGATVNLYATLNPIPPAPSYGNIQVTSHPSGAVVTLDGGSRQYTPATFSSVTAGTSHTIQITMSGYQPYGTSAYVAAGQTSILNAYLVPYPPQPQTGSLSIVTVPQGADIYVDGNYFAESPYVVTSLATGSHLVRLHKSGYNEYLATVTITAGRQTPVSVTLAPQQANVGSIEVASTPAGSSVYLDGNYMGLTPPGSYLDLTSVLQGTHTILVRHTDFVDFTQTFFVSGGASVTVDAHLTPVTPSPEPDTTGQIIVVSTPAGAELFLDNTFRGITPATLSDIPAGAHVVMARQAGYTDASQAVTVIGGQSVPVALSLTALPVTTKTPLTVIPALGALAAIGIFLSCSRRRR
jgi:hypothetical protein